MSSQHLSVAKEAALAAADIICHYYQGDFKTELKEDQSPVTVADVESERVIRDILCHAFPNYGFYGEETGSSDLEADYIWLVDPIDGTKSFVRGYPFFSTQIALMHRGELIVGVSSAPLFEEIAWASKGQGAYLNEKPVSVSTITRLQDATLSIGNVATLARGEDWKKLGGLITRVSRIRGYGDFYHYHLLASGKIDVVIESDVNILDIAALAVIVQEAGGSFAQLDGQPISLETTSVLASNGCFGQDIL